MKAAIYREFEGPIEIETVEDPSPPEHGAVIRVEANGICRSDWHGWKGHDPLIETPHIPGHEIAGVVEACGSGVHSLQPGDRITLPFSCGCGVCGHCRGGQHQICDQPYQPGFSGWGAFAEYVAVPNVDVNGVQLPDDVTAVQAAGLGCRFATAYRAVAIQADVRPGEYVAVYGCGGVGLSAIHIAAALGARPIAIDVRQEALDLAMELGAEKAFNARGEDRVSSAVRSFTQGGAQVSIDALGSRETCLNSVMSLAKHGRHIQVGLMTVDDRKATIPMARVIAWELTLRGSFGLQPPAYPSLLSMIDAGHIDPGRLVTREVTLTEGAEILQRMDREPPTGVAVITEFR